MQRAHVSSEADAPPSTGVVVDLVRRAHVGGEADAPLEDTEEIDMGHLAAEHAVQRVLHERARHRGRVASAVLLLRALDVRLADEAQVRPRALQECGLVQGERRDRVHAGVNEAGDVVLTRRDADRATVVPGEEAQAADALDDLVRGAGHLCGVASGLSARDGTWDASTTSRH